MQSDHMHALPAGFKRARIFAGVSDHEIEKLASRFTARTFSQGEYLFHEREPATLFYLIIEGRVKILQTSVEGLEVILNVFGPGELIGALPTLGQGNYPASGEALTDVIVYEITPLNFEDILLHHPKITLNLLRFVTGRLQSAHRQLRVMATERVERRIASALLQLARQAGKQVAEGILLDLPLSRKDLADMSGTTEYTASRTLKEWERRSIVSTAREQVTVLNIQSLTALANDLPLPDAPTGKV